MRRWCAPKRWPRLPVAGDGERKAATQKPPTSSRHDRRAAQRFRRHQHGAGELAACRARCGRARCSARPGPASTSPRSTTRSIISNGCSPARLPGYFGVDTVYHDRQHTLDITLALARLIVGYERQQEPKKRASAPSARWSASSPGCSTTSAICAAPTMTNRATARNSRARTCRAARASSRTTCRTVGLGAWVPIATEIVHFTGYEVPFAQIKVTRSARHQARASDRHRGHDRADGGSLLSREMPRPAVCRVRARRRRAADGRQRRAAGQIRLGPRPAAPDARVRRRSAHQAPRRQFGGAYRYLEVLFGGRNPYIEAIDRNVDYLRQILRSENWRLLRRNPPVFAARARHR